MKKSIVLSTPTRIDDLSFDEFYDEDTGSLKEQRLNVQKWRRFKHEDMA